MFHDILILLRNPYGEERGCELKGNLEYRLHRVIRMALKYMDDPESNLVSEGMPDRTKKALEDYFYGDDGIRERLKDGLIRIEKGDKPFFLNERNIFEKSVRDPSLSELHRGGGLKVGDAEIKRLVEDEVKRVLAERGLRTGEGRNGEEGGVPGGSPDPHRGLCPPPRRWGQRRPIERWLLRKGDARPLLP